MLKRYNRVRQSWQEIVEKILKERKIFEEREAVEIKSCLESLKDSTADEKRHYLQLWQDFKSNEQENQ